MGHINFGRTILGGIAAGIVINVVEWFVNSVMLRERWAAAMSALGRSGEFSTNQMVGFSLWGLAVGIVMVWLYAAIRPRYGAGPKTAICAGVAVWALAYAAGSATVLTLGLFPLDLMMIGLAVGLVETVAAALAGAWVYREGHAAEPHEATPLHA